MRNRKAVLHKAVPHKAVLCATGLLMFGASGVIAQPPDPRPPLMPEWAGEGRAPAPALNPTDTIYAFVLWFNEMNLRECAALVDGGQFNEALDKMQREIDQEMDKERPFIMIDEPRIEMIEDDRARAPGQPEVEIGNDKVRANVQTTVVTFQGRLMQRQTGIDWLQLRLVGNVWKLVPDDPKAPRRNVRGHGALQEFINFIASPVQARSNARESSCLSNMKQLGLGMMQLAQDFDEKFDINKMQELQRGNNQFAKWPTWAQAVFPYVKNMQIFRCPADPDKGEGEGVVSYSFNDNLQGVGLAQIANPSEIVLLYEGKDGKLEFRHDGRALICFADGHVKFVNEEQAEKLQWKP